MSSSMLILTKKVNKDIYNILIFIVDASNYAQPCPEGWDFVSDANKCFILQKDLLTWE